MDKYYIFITDNKIDGKGQLPLVDELCIEVTKDIYDNIDKYIYKDGGLVLNPNYEEEQKKKEYERVANLTMTALDFINFLRSKGLSLEVIRTFLDNNIELDTQLKYCQNVYCGVACSIMPITLDGITITKEDVIEAFKNKNNEN